MGDMDARGKMSSAAADGSQGSSRQGTSRKGSGMKGSGMRLTVITPEEEFYDGMVESVVVRTLDGYIGFLENRAPACVLLHDEGSLQFREKNEKEMVRAFLNGGFAFVDEEVTIYTDSASWPEAADLDGESPEASEFHQAMAAGAELAKQSQKEKGARANPKKLRPDTEPRD